MKTLLEKAFKEVKKLPSKLQNESAQQLLSDIENKLKWQAMFSYSNIDMDSFESMAQALLVENEMFKTSGNEAQQ